MVLTGVAAEFRIALREEIEAAKRAASSSAVRLENGRRVAQLGKAVQYQFNLESALQLPEDSPGDLHVPQHPPLEATIVSVKGTLVTVSVSEDLGSFVPKATLQTNMVFLLRKLVERIESLAPEENAPGTRLLHATARMTPTVVPQSLPLNVEQLRAVRAALQWDAAYIWGPPGTGKTRTIGYLGSELSARGASLLIVSHTNAAVDQAILAVAEAIGSDLTDGSVIRVGEATDKRLLEKPRLLARTLAEDRSAELAARKSEVERARAEMLEHAVRVGSLLELAEWVDVAPSDIEAMDSSRLRLEDEYAAVTNLGRQRDVLVDARAARVHRAGEAKHALDVRESMQGWVRELTEANARIEASAEDEAAAFAELRDEQEVHDRTVATGGLVRRWRGLPKPEAQARLVETKAMALDEASGVSSAAQAAGAEREARLASAQEELSRFREAWEAEPEHVLEGAHQEQRLESEITNEWRGRNASLATDKKALEDLVSERITSLIERELLDIRPSSVEGSIAGMWYAFKAASRQLEGSSAVALRLSLNDLNRRISALDDELTEIEGLLARVEETIIAEARIVGTTLTRAYLRDSIQKRRFDTVVLDEASMAPIPALWVAAHLADRGIVIVGDFRQLPPIKHSNHPLAEQWLGKDVFEVSGVKALYESANVPEVCSTLVTQHRMHPQISAIPNDLVYDGRLRDAVGIENDEELAGWYDTDWGHDAPVLLVDTSDIDAWVTSVKRANGSSRLNFLSATVCVDLASRLLRSDRPAFVLGEPPRVMLACPYRPHARLLSLLAREEFPDGEVVAGTAHTFQGSEASAVVFDLVNDEPHWRVGMFDPQRDEPTRRLVNVAITRAKRRLLIVGDFDYVGRNARRAFMGEFVRYLLHHYPVVEARAILPEGFAARAARTRQLTVGDAEEPGPGSRVVVTQSDFYGLLQRDVSAAERRLVIYSPFITSNRLSLLQPELRAAIERGVRTYVVTKAPSERSKRTQATYAGLESALRGWGVTLIHKFHMHEKLVIVDDAILWSGSLNPLSFSDTQEIMERRESAAIVEHYAKTLRLAEMLGVYDAGEGECPFCGKELMPAEGRDEPFYWRCVEDGCHTRGIGDDAPKDGRVVCTNCGSPLYFGEWGGAPHWRCESNPRHRMKVARSHIRLPKMRALIPPKDLKQLDTTFRIRT